MNWQSATQRTVTGLGFELVGVEKSAGGLLRVYIDHPAPADGTDDKAITVDDCEVVTRQLQHLLEVEDVAYERLEVSSPGLDRPLTKAADYLRFVGRLVEVTLNEPLRGRRKYRGELQALGDAWRLVLREPAPRTAKAPRPAKAAEPAPTEALDFRLDEVKEARLVPVVDFKGRRFAGAGASEADATATVEPGSAGLGEGDRIQ